MGSLLPCWDVNSPGVAPKEFQDINEEEEEEHQGYFASYAKLKKLHSLRGERSSPLPMAQRSASLTRRSLPQQGGAGESPMSPPLARRSLGRADSLAASPGGGLRTASSVTPSGGSGTARGGLQRMYSMPMTRGERSDVLAGVAGGPTGPLGVGALGGASPRSPGSLDAYRTRQPDKAAPDVQWWRRFDSAALNERPDLPTSKGPGYTPQFGTTGQGMAYHLDVHKEGPPEIHAH